MRPDRVRAPPKWSRLSAMTETRPKRQGLDWRPATVPILGRYGEDEDVEDFLKITGVRPFGDDAY